MEKNFYSIIYTLKCENQETSRKTVQFENVHKCLKFYMNLFKRGNASDIIVMKYTLYDDFVAGEIIEDGAPF